MDPALIYGPYAGMVLLVYAVIHLYKENTALRKDAMDLLKKYQERDEEERSLRAAEEREELKRLREREAGP